MDMRRAKRQVTDIELIKKLIEEVQVVRLAINGEIYPYVVPVNFGYSWDNNDQLTLYIHGAKEGKKVSMLEKNPLVAIEMDSHHKLIEGNKKCFNLFLCLSKFDWLWKSRNTRKFGRKEGGIGAFNGACSKRKRIRPHARKNVRASWSNKN